VLTTAQGAGAVVGALCLASLAARLGRGRLLAASLILLPVALAVYGASPTRLWGAAALFALGIVYIAVLSGLSTVVQLSAPHAYRGRVLGFFVVALGVAYPIGSLVQGPVIDRIGMAGNTVGAAALLSLIMAVTVMVRPAILRALTTEAQNETPEDAPAPGGAPAPAAARAEPPARPLDPARAQVPRQCCTPE
jgi:predicted MFS family arabinose efflux permease